MSRGLCRVAPMAARSEPMAPYRWILPATSNPRDAPQALRGQPPGRGRGFRMLRVPSIAGHGTAKYRTTAERCTESCRAISTPSRKGDSSQSRSPLRSDAAMSVPSVWAKALGQLAGRLS